MHFAIGTAAFLLQALSYLSPDWALILLTVGLLLMYVELNRPGWIFPGAIGLLAFLLAVASLVPLALNPGAIALICTAIALLAVDLLRHTQAMVAVAATLGLVLGFSHLVLGPGVLRIHTLTAIVCGLVIGSGTSVLTRIARRARANKGLD